jgi:exodeoxyribonuclease III
LRASAVQAVRVVFWNIRAGGGRRAVWIADQIAAWAPDVLGLCEFRGTEASQQLAQTLAAQGLSFQQQSTDPQNLAVNACLLASRTPLKPISLRRNPPERARWIMARIEHGPAVGILHAPNFVTKRKRPFFNSVSDFAGRWRDGPALFGGDTNCGVPPIDGNPNAFHDWEVEWIPELARIGWADIYRHQNPSTRWPTWYSPNAGNGYRLDQAFVNRSLLPAMRPAHHAWGTHPDAPRTRHALSDHAALIVDFDWPRPS